MRLLVPIFATLVAVGIIEVHGAISPESPPFTKEENGRTVKYCEYKGIKLLPPSKINDYDSCHTCWCRKSGFQCATMEGLDPEISDDSKCTVVKVACKNQWRRKENINKRCRKGDKPAIEA